VAGQYGHSWPGQIVVFLEKGRVKIIIKNILALVGIAFPVLLPFFNTDPVFLFLLNVSYVVYYLFIFYEVLKFLLRPGYINSDIIVAAACGFFLLLETFVFLLQIWVYDDPGSFRGIDLSTPAHTFIDLVYFCSITLTTIGFGDITPAAPDTKLISSLIGVIGQFYSVVLVGIIISKFAASSKPE